jgi:PAS domain S-box-containing protein
VTEGPGINFKAILDGLDAAVVVLDLYGVLLYANDRAAEMLDWLAETSIGTAVAQEAQVQIPPETAAAIAETLRSGRSWEGDFELRRKDGGLVSVHASETGLFDESGTLIGVVSIITDVTESRRSVQKLISEAEALRFLLDATTILSSALDFEECVRQLAALAVPLIGDMCLIDVLEDGAVRRVAAVHADPSRAALAQRLVAFPPSTLGPDPVAQTIRSGQPVYSNLIDNGFLRLAAADDEHYRVVEELGVTAYMSAPLKVRGRVLGSVTLVSAGSGRTFDDNDLALAGELAARAGQVVENARLFSEQARVARTLQAALLPPALPDIPSMELAAAYQAGGRGNEVGGDFYDVFEIGRSGWVLAVGDVSGRGPDAAAVTGLVRHALRASAQHDRNPAGMLAVANRLLIEQEDHSFERFCTAACAVVRPGDPARVTVAEAGHPPLIVVRADGTIESYATGAGPALGITDDFSARAQRLTVRAGDLLLLYTDGLTEARNAEGSFFGEERLGHLLAQLVRSRPSEVVRRLLDEVTSYCGGELKDDLSLLVAAPS